MKNLLTEMGKMDMFIQIEAAADNAGYVEIGTSDFYHIASELGYSINFEDGLYEEFVNN